MCTVLLLTVQMSLFTSCNDDLAAIVTILLRER